MMSAGGAAKAVVVCITWRSLVQIQAPLALMIRFQAGAASPAVPAFFWAAEIRAASPTPAPF
ncbi:MAG: hypothetical protein COV76_00385 [Candidatus Omnitrophica bacterium CG11_big_fil_rev_8_21_14_0_20_64_10]|nr:MAG: hypothetical protein COV76_00385 [Candidatus Omnitrophica bacterium CG11_big_fil_rev_8_21_14_0_20_64_10]